LAVGLLLAATLVAGIPLQPGTTIEFSTVAEGRSVLGARDEFIQAMSQLDRCLRMKTTTQVTEAQFLSFVQNQVLTWSAADQVKLSNVICSVQSSFSELQPALPGRVLLIKTTGNEEGNAAYCRVGAIVLPQQMVNGSSDYGCDWK